MYSCTWVALRVYVLRCFIGPRLAMPVVRIACRWQWRIIVIALVSDFLLLPDWLAGLYVGSRQGQLASKSPAHDPALLPGRKCDIPRLRPPLVELLRFSVCLPSLERLLPHTNKLGQP
jgi:hypothetical protein|eukprot:COSAG01_NODE_25422_length_745_cov_5.221362_1_plen_118_part_00